MVPDCEPETAIRYPQKDRCLIKVIFFYLINWFNMKNSAVGYNRPKGSKLDYVRTTEPIDLKQVKKRNDMVLRYGKYWN